MENLKKLAALRDGLLGRKSLSLFGKLGRTPMYFLAFPAAMPISSNNLDAPRDTIPLKFQSCLIPGILHVTGP